MTRPASSMRPAWQGKFRATLTYISYPLPFRDSSFLFCSASRGPQKPFFLASSVDTIAHHRPDVRCALRRRRLLTEPSRAMPKIRKNSCLGTEFQVSPWQSKKRKHNEADQVRDVAIAGLGSGGRALHSLPEVIQMHFKSSVLADFSI